MSAISPIMQLIISLSLHSVFSTCPAAPSRYDLQRPLQRCSREVSYQLCPTSVRSPPSPFAAHGRAGGAGQGSARRLAYSTVPLRRRACARPADRGICAETTQPTRMDRQAPEQLMRTLGQRLFVRSTRSGTVGGCPIEIPPSRAATCCSISHGDMLCCTTLLRTAAWQRVAMRHSAQQRGSTCPAAG